MTPARELSSEQAARDLALLAALEQRRDIAGDGREWHGLVRAAHRERVAALLYDSLCRSHRLEELPVAELLALTIGYGQVAANNAALFEVASDVLAWLTEAGIPAIVLKGVALSELVYRDRSVRPMEDLDLLVPGEEADRAVGLLARAGYRRLGRPELRRGFDREFRAEVTLESPGPVRAFVEVHWQLIGPVFACRHVDYAAVWRQAVSTRIAGQPTRVLGAEDWVLHQAAHAVLKHRRVTLLDLVDIDRLVAHLGTVLDWERLFETARAYRWTPAIAEVLGEAARALGTPVPTSLLEKARENPLPLIERRLLAWWLDPGRPERHHIVPDWLTLPSVGARVRFLRGYLVPSRDYLRGCFTTGSGGWSPRAYLRYLWREVMS